MTAQVERLRIQYISDIHLEFYDKRDKGKVFMTQFLSPVAPYLALCGDIGNPSRPAYRAFLAQCSAAFERVFMIPGNHEYYNFDQKGGVTYSMEKKNDQMQTICASFPNVVWLQERAVWLEREKVWVCGATLWNNVDTHQEKEAEDIMTDYKTIRLERGRKWKAADTRIEHAKQKGILRWWIDHVRERGEKIVILSHHLPSLGWIHPDFAKSKVNWCYASKCDDMLRSPVIGWLCGHTHRAQSFWLGRGDDSMYCGINPWGYPFENIGGGRTKTAVMEWPRPVDARSETILDSKEEIIFI